MAGDRVMRGLRMVRAPSVHRTDQRELVHSLGDFWQQLRDLNSGDIGGDRLEVAVGFRIPGVDVAGTAFEPEQDDRIRLAGTGPLPVDASAAERYSLSVKPRKPSEPTLRKLLRESGVQPNLCHRSPLMILREFS